jgi:magnesium-transporting ATPase (P-type)
MRQADVARATIDPAEWLSQSGWRQTVAVGQESKGGVDARSGWHGSEASAVAAELGVEPERGLSAEEARRRLQQHGPNRLAGAKKESGLQAFLRQYRDFMQIILLAAAVINLLVTGDVGDLGGAGRADGVQRGDRAAPGGQGRGERQGAGPDDEDDRPGPPRRPGAGD